MVCLVLLYCCLLYTSLRSHYRGWLAKDGDFRYTPEALGELKQEDVVKVLTDRADACLLYTSRCV